MSTPRRIFAAIVAIAVLLGCDRCAPDEKEAIASRDGLSPSSVSVTTEESAPVFPQFSEIFPKTGNARIDQDINMLSVEAYKLEADAYKLRQWCVILEVPSICTEVVALEKRIKIFSTDVRTASQRVVGDAGPVPLAQTVADLRTIYSADLEHAVAAKRSFLADVAEVRARARTKEK